jgi:putative transposase
MPQSFTCLSYHIIFSTKDRVPSIADEIQDRLYQYIGGVIRAADGVLLLAGGTADHIHLLASISKQQSISDALRNIKTNSSRWVHETFPKHQAFQWQSGYAAFSVSYSNVADVKAYIGNQAEHHRKTTFKEEYIAFLKRHDIQYDEKYIWEGEY